MTIVEKTTPSEDVDLAWLGGILDGEGSIGVYFTAKGASIVNISIVNSDEKILYRVEEIYKRLGIFYCRYKHNNHNPKGFKSTKPCYVLTVRRKVDALILAKKLITFIVGNKKESTNKLIEFLENNPKPEYHKKYTCIFCKNEYLGRKRKYCSLKCWHDFAQGVNNPNHKHGNYIARND